MIQIVRSSLWLAFFGAILAAWWVMYNMATDMDLDLLGRPGPMGQAMAEMDPRMPMDMSGDRTDMSGGMEMSDMADEGMAMADGASDGMAMSEGMSGGMDMSGDTSGDMAMSDDMGMDMQMDMPMAQFGPLFSMWAIMMAAMMFPTMLPTLSTYETLITSADGSRAGWLGVLLGYFIVWVGFAALIASLQRALLFGGVINMLGVAPLWLSAILLIIVGAYQFSRVKEICHGVCHAPMTYFLGHWRTGFTGGLRMGLGLGAFCVGCCWGFMLLGFVGGVMSLLWMGLATLFMVFEKLPDIGQRLTKPAGVVLILAGVGLGATIAI